jgi:hypothetical protein
MRISTTLGATALVMTVAAPPAMADSGWRMVEVVVSNAAESESFYRALPEASDQQSVILSCPNGEYRAIFSVEPFDFATLDSVGVRRQQRSHKVSFRVNGEETERSNWDYFSSLKLATPRNDKIARQTFNAVVRQDAISYKMPGKDEVAVTLPPADGEFAEFARRCKALKDTRD